MKKLLQALLLKKFSKKLVSSKLSATHQANHLLKKVQPISSYLKYFTTQNKSKYYCQSSIDLEEISPYQIGEEVKYIDWNITARTSIPHIRKSRQKTPLEIVFLIDVSNSMNFENKKEKTSEILSSLLLGANQKNIPSGAIYFADKYSFFCPPKPKNANQIITNLLSIKPRQKTSSIQELIQRIRSIPENLIQNFAFILFSDFLDLEMNHFSFFSPFNCLFFHLYHPNEIKLPSDEIFIAKCLETGEKIKIEKAKIASIYEKLAQKKLQELQNQLKKYHIPLIKIPSTNSLSNIEKSFLSLFQK